MLSRVGRLAAATFALAAASARPAAAGGADAGLRTPIRLTAGSSNQLMGVFSPDETALYFVSDDSATLDLMIQHPVDSGARAVTTGMGDVAWPQPSPDGKRIAYISYERDATGDVCVRPVRGGRESCLTGADTAELQVLWWGDDALGVLARDQLHGDFSFRRIAIGGGAPRTVIKGNMVGLALAPDARWLAYVPLTRRRKQVGVTFSNRTAAGIRLSDLEHRGKPIAYTPALPGTTGQLAFSRDGRWLYFTQYLSDTNRDGAIDGDDNGVIFRVAFDPSSRHAPIAREPEQLTSAAWNCHYPAPAATRVAMTCSHQGSLDVYRLPLDGSVPAVWKRDRILGELEVARDLSTQLLLLSRLRSLARTSDARDDATREMIVRHLELREYESALYHAGRLDRARGRRATWARLVVELAKHRRADLALVRGQLSRPYIAAETARLARVDAIAADASDDDRHLAAVIASEIEDDLGDKAGAAARFDKVEVAAVADPLILPLIAERGRRLFALAGDRDRALGLLRALAEHAAFDTPRRLRHARQYVDELVRGVPAAARAARVAAARKSVDDNSDLALLLDVERSLLGISDAEQERVRAELFALYKANKQLDRRRALVLASITTAARRGNEYLQYQFATSWASWLRRSHPERKYAETLYRSIVLDRAYGEAAQGKIAEARGYFWGTTLSASSLEGHVGFIESRLREGKRDLDALYVKRFQREPDNPERLFVDAYRIARELPRQKNAQRHDADVDKVISLLRKADDAMPQRAEIHQLWGYALHQRARRTGSRPAAVSASREYQLALDLARDNPRIEAAVLHELGLIQAALGNHRRALDLLRRREQMPHPRPGGELALRVAIARSAWLTGDSKAAQDQLAAARKLIARHRSLRKYLPLVVDRLALAQWTGRAYPEAQATYRDLVSIVDRARGEVGQPVNRVKARIGLAAAAVQAENPAAALPALRQADAVLAAEQALRTEPKPRWNTPLLHDYQYERDQLAAIASGLFARAHRQAGDLAASARSLDRRYRQLGERYARSQADEDLLELARVNYHRGELAYRRGRIRDAVAWIELGLDQSDQFNRKTGSEVNDVGLNLLRAYAELHLYGGVTRAKMARDVAAELMRSYAHICKFPSPSWEPQRFLFEIYLTMLSQPQPEENRRELAKPIDPRRRERAVGARLRN